MANIYTSKFKLRKPAAGDLSWDDEVNDNTTFLELLMAAIKRGNQVVYGLVASNSAGLVIDYTAGRVVVNGVVYNISASSKTAVDLGGERTPNYLYVDSAGLVQIAQTAPTGEYALLAVIDVESSTVARIADMREEVANPIYLDRSADPWILTMYDATTGDTALFDIDATTGIATPSSGGGASLAIKEGVVSHLLINGSFKGITKLYTPQNFNQQWGGNFMPWEVDGKVYEASTGYIKDSGNSISVGTASAQNQVFQSFVATATTVEHVILRTFKTGNPTDNTTIDIYSDSAGVPNASLGSMSRSNKTISSNVQETVFTFGTPVTGLSVGTKYHIVVGRSGAVDASNYTSLRRDNAGAYPHGNGGYNNGTTPWVTQSVVDAVFAVVPTAATSAVQSGGLYLGVDCGLTSRKPIGDWVNENVFSKSIRTTLAAGDKDKTIFDVGESLDANRIRLSTTSLGYLNIDVWESDGTKHTVTGSTDYCTGTEFIASFAVRFKGDGSDFVKLWANDTAQGTALTAQTITFDEEAFNSQHILLGYGWPTAPTWTQDLDMSALPSTAGWTWTGTATEANAMSVSGGKLYQNGNGYAATDTGYYAKTTTLNNTTGWIVETKIQIKNNTNTINEGGVSLHILDGTKAAYIIFHEYYIEFNNLSGAPNVQIDLKSSPNSIIVTGKGSDLNCYVNGKLVLDGTGLLTATTATNAVRIGDQDPTSGENSDVIWDYLKYYEGSVEPDQLSSSSIIHEEVTLNREIGTSYLTAIAAATTLKEPLGLPCDYYLHSGYSWILMLYGIVSTPSTTSTSFTKMDDMECYVLATEEGEASLLATVYNSLSGSTTTIEVSINSDSEQAITDSLFTSSGSNENVVSAAKRKLNNKGINNIRGMWVVSGGSTGYSSAKRRILQVVEAS